MPRALLTGPRPHLGPAGAAFARAGFSVVTWETAVPPIPPPGANRRSFAGILRKSNAGTGPDGLFDCYVQLPCGAASAGTQAAPDELVGRIDTLAAVAGRLAPTASVLLGVEEATSSADPDAGTLAPDLLAAVALALLEDLGRSTTRVAVLPVAALCRPPAVKAAMTGASAEGLVDAPLGAPQWEMPTPPLVSAP